ncbi:hypothetical protein ERJ70_18005 [Sediminibacillus dalangtanensis]|uniref:Uncharacterized protein n=1 Tax=Sediminibacillus dalangtanensis TaxID=2729421 RepID=A0ABX7VVM0_9BACI|nr:hypothetical protein [Sediminibacillus dalangtanensis]QTN01015.1 hypothetical protein ERJ70_18005 [Sediminibacillus dalangtanensis]
MAVRPCPVLGVHRMLPAAIPAKVVMGVELTFQTNMDFLSIRNVVGADCSGHPAWHPLTAIGYYASGVKILGGMGGSTGGVKGQVNEGSIRYTSASSLEGYNFQNY